jgi:molybdate transport system substrate-binding protein
MRLSAGLRAFASSLFCLSLLALPASADEIRVMISAGFFSVYKELGPAFEKSTGHKLVTTRGPSVGDSPEAIPTRLSRGEEADVVIMDGTGVDLLDQRELTRPGSRIPLAQSFIGMVVRAGQPKPDIGTMDGLRGTLLAAKSIAVSDSSSGTYLSTIGFKKLGVADEVAGKTRKVRGPPSGELVASVVARGEAEVGFQQVPELIHVPGVDFVGRVPSDVQPPTLYVGALPKNSQHADAGIALMGFLSSADAAEVIAKAGLKPLRSR